MKNKINKVITLVLAWLFILSFNAYKANEPDLSNLQTSREELPTGLKVIDETNVNNVAKPRNYEVKDLSENFKVFIKKELRGAEFRIDNSFVYKKELFLPLIPSEIKAAESPSTVTRIPDSGIPDLIWLSNGWAYVRVLKNKDGSTSLIDVSKIPEDKREAFKSLRLPKDLVVPEKLNIDKRVANIFNNVDSLNENTKKVEENIKTQQNNIAKLEMILKAQENKIKRIEEEAKEPKISVKEVKNISDKGPSKGSVFLTSPDTGKIIHIDFNDSSKVRQIQTMGLPLEIDYSSSNKCLYISDLAHGKVYKLNTLENKFPDIVDIPSCIKPKDLKLSTDGENLYLLNSPKHYLIVHNLSDKEKTRKIKLNHDAYNLGIIDNTIAITSPNDNKLLFIDKDSLEIIGALKIEGSPSKIILDKRNELFYITCRTSNKIVVVDPATHTIKKEIKVGIAPTSLVVHPNNNVLYVGNGKSDTISLIDTETLDMLDDIKLPIDTQFPSDLIISNDGKWLIVTSESTGTIAIIETETNKISKKIDLSTTTHSGYFVE